MNIEQLHVCEICFHTYPSSSVNPEWPTCPDCESEALSINLIPLRTYLESSDRQALEDIKTKIMSNTNLYEHYRKAVADRIEGLIKEIP